MFAAPPAGGLDANQGGINYGTVKLGCHWMAALSSVSQAGCSSTIQPYQLTMSRDALYGFNSTCFSVYASGTKIDCGGHTIIATNNGSFAKFMNSQNQELLNCFLKGFSNPVLVMNSSASIMNNTMYANGTAISVLNSQNARVQDNNITMVQGNAGTYGINVANSTNGYIINNIVNGAKTAYWLDNVSNFTVQNDTSTNVDSLGMYMINSSANQFQTDSFIASTTGIECAASRSLVVRTWTTAGLPARPMSAAHGSRARPQPVIVRLIQNRG